MLESMSHCPLLSLPKSIRVRIYGYVAWISDRVISLNNVKSVQQRDTNRLDCFGSYEHSCIHRRDDIQGVLEDHRDPNLLNLFLSCRKVYLEATCFVFSNCKTGVRNSESGSIDKLLVLSLHTISCLTDLTVRLNDQVSPDARPQRAGRAAWVHDRYYLDLDLGSARDEATVYRWRHCAEYLFSHIVPFSLTLNFICETQSTELATLATEPFSKTKTPLRECNIKLSHLPRKEFQLLAKRASFNGTGKCRALLQRDQPFPLLKLPKEIRLQILQYTDLVTPIAEVEWKQDLGFHMHYGTTPCEGRLPYKSVIWKSPCHTDGRKDGIFLECKRGILLRRHIYCKSRECGTHQYTGCFCHRHHGAYTTNCRCWMPPIAFFLVSRAFREECIEIFYSRNRFVVTPRGDVHQPTDISTNGTAIEQFLTRIVPQTGKRFIKRLQIVLPPFRKEVARTHEGNRTDEHPMSAPYGPQFYKSWLRALSIISSELTLPGLKMEMFVAGWYRIKNFNQEYYRYRKFLTEEQGQAVERSYVEFYKPAAQLKGLRDFFVFLDWPWYGKGLNTEWEPRRHAQIYEPEMRSTHLVEKEIEQHVMGEAYDSVLRGKGETLDDIGWRLFDEDNSWAQPWPRKRDRGY